MKTYNMNGRYSYILEITKDNINSIEYELETSMFFPSRKMFLHEHQYSIIFETWKITILS